MGGSVIQKRLVSVGGVDGGDTEYWQYRITIPSKIASDAGLHAGQYIRLGINGPMLISGTGNRMVKVARKRTRTHNGKEYYVTMIIIPLDMIRVLGWSEGDRIIVENEGEVLTFRRE